MLRRFRTSRSRLTLRLRWVQEEIAYFKLQSRRVEDMGIWTVLEAQFLQDMEVLRLPVPSLHEMCTTNTSSYDAAVACHQMECAIGGWQLVLF